MIVAAIDPGLSGGAAVIDPLTVRTCHSMLLPTVERKGKNVIDVIHVADWLTSYEVEHVVLERSQSMPAQGVSSTFTLGKAFGMLLGMLDMMQHQTDYTLVAPQTWKRHFDLLKADKNASRDKAIELFPTCRDQFERVKDQHRAEAALMAQWYMERS